MKTFWMVVLLFAGAEVSHKLLVEFVGGTAVLSGFAVASRAAIYFIFGVYTRHAKRQLQFLHCIYLVLIEYILFGSISVSILSMQEPDLSLAYGIGGLFLTFPLVLVIAAIIVFSGRVSGRLYDRANAKE